MNYAPLLVLPVVGGYAFSAIWIASLFNASRESGHRLYFRSVFYAVFLVACATLIHIIFFESEWYKQTLHFIGDALRIHLGHSMWGSESRAAILVLSFALGPVIAHLLNVIHLHELLRWLPERFPNRALLQWQTLILRKAIKENDFELLVYRAAQTESPIMFTLNTGKVYVGKVVRGPNPAEQRHAVRIAPLLSGYRSKETHEFKITTDYYEAMSELAKPSAERSDYFQNLELEDFEIVFPSDQICSAHFFDMGVYANHFLNEDDLEDLDDLGDDDQATNAGGFSVVSGGTVSCGGVGGYEHPIVNLQISNGRSAACPYCSRVYDVIGKPS